MKEVSDYEAKDKAGDTSNGSFGKHIGYAGRHIGRGIKHAVKNAVTPE